MKKKLKKQMVKIYEILADIRCRLNVKNQGFHCHCIRDAPKKERRMLTD